MPITPKEAAQLNGAKAEMKKIWVSACKHDQIEALTTCAIFSNNNPFAKQHNDMMGEYFKLVKRIKANIRRRERHAAMTDLGLTRVKGSLDGTYYE